MGRLNRPRCRLATIRLCNGRGRGNFYVKTPIHNAANPKAGGVNVRGGLVPELPAVDNKFPVL